MLAHAHGRSPKSFEELKEQAIEQALAGEWQHAAELNSEALRLVPDDVETLNRLAKAQIELGRYEEAKASAETALTIKPHNGIARRHLERIEQLGSSANGRKPSFGPRARPVQFIADRARATVTELRRTASPSVLASVSPGDILSLQPDGTRLAVLTAGGDYLGHLEVRIAQRLRRLMDGGNEYEAAVAKLSSHEVAVLIRETRRSPEQDHIVSFPPPLQKTAAEFDFDDDAPEEFDDEFGGAHVDDDELESDAPQSERLKMLLNGDLDALDDEQTMAL